MADEGYERLLPRSRRRAAGVYYTPEVLAREVVAETLAPLLATCAWRTDGSPMLRLLDPACGTGRFLAAAADLLADEAVRRGHEREAARRAILLRVVVGVERDPDAANHARALGGEVRVGEALAGGVIEEGAWDAVVGNPPWVRSVRLKQTDPVLWRQLRGALAATSYGEWDLYAAFLERALTWARPGGEIGLVVPSRWLTAKNGAPLRERLAALRAVRRIVDFGAAQLFAGATTYSALVYLTRAGTDRVRVVRRGREGEVSHATLGRAPWVLAIGDEARLLARLTNGTRPLGELARVAKGAGTNADGVFLLEAAAADGLECCVPCLRGRDVQPFRTVDARVALLPYERGRWLTPDELAQRAPRALAHLLAHREQLEQRERGRFRGDTLFRWGRPQNLAWLLDPTPKLVLPDAARGGRAALDGRGRLVIDTAYAVRPTGDVPIGLLLAVLNSSVVAAWLRATGVPLRGDYFRMKTAYLASLPVPDPATAAARAVASDALAVDPDDTAACRALGERTAALYGVSCDELDAAARC